LYCFLFSCVNALLSLAPKTGDLAAILAGALGGGRKLWPSTAVTVSGGPPVDAMKASGQWLCTGRAVGEEVVID